MTCDLCPRRCHAARSDSEGTGFCGMGFLPVVARAALHAWEEPCISGEGGSGAVFFSGCNLRCAYCQNHDISAGGKGLEISVSRLREIFSELAAQGAHNINLVTATHFAPAVLEALEPAPPVPVVWNCGGYETAKTIRALSEKVQIWLPDMKYSDAGLAEALSAALDYPEVSKAAIGEMFEKAGPYVLDENGLMKSGVLIRHLVLPGFLDNTFGVLDWIAENFRPGDVMVSLMGQYTPNGAGGPGRRLAPEEYQRAVRYMKALGILEGYTQEVTSAKEEYTPPFDGTGVIR